MGGVVGVLLYIMHRVYYHTRTLVRSKHCTKTQVVGGPTRDLPLGRDLSRESMDRRGLHKSLAREK